MVSFSFGAEADCCSEASSSSIAVTGGLVASGDGANIAGARSADEGGRARGEPEAPGVGTLKPPKPGCELPAAIGAVTPGGPVVDKAGLIGGAPELNSAQRGHFRFVSVFKKSQLGKSTDSVGKLTHMAHLSAVAAPSLE